MKSIKSKIMISISAIVIVSLVIVGGFSSYMNYVSTMDTLKSTMVETVKVAASSVKASLEVNKAIVYEISRLPWLIDENYPKDQIITYLNDKKNYYGLQSIGYADMDGNEIVSGKNISSQPFFEGTANGSLTVYEPARASGASSLYIAIATPVMKNNKPYGVLYAWFPGEMLSNITNNIKVGETGEGFMLGKTGLIISSADQLDVLNQTSIINNAAYDKKLKEMAEIHKKMVAQEIGTTIYSQDGKSRMMAYAPVDNETGWSIGISADLNEFTASMWMGIAVSVVMIILFVVLAIIVSARVSNEIASPIARLTSRIKRLAQGDLKSDVPAINQKDEVGVLAQATTAQVYSLRAIINDLSHVLTQMADNQLDVESTATYVGDYKVIQSALRKIIYSFNTTVTRMNQASTEVAQGSAQIASGGQSLSQASTEQASIMEELTSTITNIAKQVRSNAENTSHVGQVSLQSQQKLRSSNTEMTRMVEAMEEINEATQNIRRIIKTIDDIAFQTNILALNAAVEAARAGDAGRGFAVVADEVRNLASKSAQAADTTTALIAKTIDAVDKGTKIAGSTAKDLDEVIRQFSATTAMMENITKSTQEQTDAIQQVMTGVDQVNTVIQTNSATAEESAAASEELTSQAMMLKELVGQFRLKENMLMASDDESNDDTFEAWVDTDDLANEKSFISKVLEKFSKRNKNKSKKTKANEAKTNNNDIGELEASNLKKNNKLRLALGKKKDDLTNVEATNQIDNAVMQDSTDDADNATSDIGIPPVDTFDFGNVADTADAAADSALTDEAWEQMIAKVDQSVDSGKYD